MLQHAASIFALLLTTGALAQFNDTPDYYKCESRVGGSWQFGRAPYACRANTYGEDSYLKQFFEVHVFDDSRSISSETKRYMSELYPTLVAIAELYFELRNPSPDPTELTYFKRAVLTIAHQESFWSHYREVNNEYKLMRGDFGHGHGIMQVDDRWHYMATEKGIAWHLVDNITYALDEYYSGWQKAQSTSCVRKGNLTDRVRAAYSAYNGGPSKICRFKNTSDRWYRNDKAFFEKWNSQSWKSYVVAGKPAPIPIRCHVLKSPCDPNQPEDPPPAPTWKDDQVYKLDNNEYCFSSSKTEQLYCQRGIKNIVCARSIDSKINVQSAQWDGDLPRLPRASYNPLNQCTQVTDRLQKVGENIQILKNINFRSTPGGTRISTLKRDSIYEVLDFEVINNRDLDLYYYLLSDGKSGYIYAGNFDNYENWARPSLSEPSAGQKLISNNPSHKELIQALDFRKEAKRSSPLLARIEKGREVELSSYVVVPPENTLFYQINFEGLSGYLQAGEVFPELNLAGKLKTPSQSEPQFEYKVRPNITYEWLRACPQIDCQKTDFYIVGQRMEDLCKKWGCNFKEDELAVHETQGEWVKITVKRGLNQGWSHESWIQAQKGAQ